VADKANALRVQRRNNTRTTGDMMQYENLEALPAKVPGDPDLKHIRPVGKTGNVTTAREPYASLFAAAPDLLDALKWIVEHCDESIDANAEHRHNGYDMAFDAIAKAQA
jgi:hypothetical protein